jgi:predicted small secreted protein
LLSGGDSHHSFNLSGGIVMFSKLIYALALLTTLALGACNTMTGVGKDVEAGGQKMQEESKEVQRKL